MALLKCDFGSGVIGQCTSLMAVIPENICEDIPAIYLLHGLSDDCTGWTRYTSVERYANERGMAVIMPGGARSFYEDMAYGQPYYTHIAKEVVDLSRRMFRLSDKREKTFIAGLSMGGYGAFKIAMRNPDVFCAAGSISGVMDISEKIEDGTWDFDMRLIFGEDFKTSVKGSDADLFTLAEKNAGRCDAPKFIQICGTEDFLYEGNLRFKDNASSLGLDLTYMEMPGNHSWGFWDKNIQIVMDFFAGLTK